MNESAAGWMNRVLADARDRGHPLVSAEVLHISAMTREEMLRHLDRHGEDAGGTFNDGEEIRGWFGWTVDTKDSAPGEAILSVTYNDDSDEGADHNWTLKWRMIPIDLPPRTADSFEGEFPTGETP